jgi:hypothetical protein
MTAAMPVTIELTAEMEHRLRREAARQGLEPQAYIARALEQHLRGSEPAGGNGARLSAREAELIQQINLGLPADLWAEYRELIRKRDEQALTPAEHQRLVSISDQIEQSNARRMTHVAQLARLRGVKLDALMNDLGISGGSHA